MEPLERFSQVARAGTHRRASVSKGSIRQLGFASDSVLHDAFNKNSLLSPTELGYCTSY
jgi:hypothetical protein